MLKALVAVDGSETALSAVRHVIKLIQDREPLEIHLVNVQPPVHGDVTTFVSHRTVHDYHVDEASRAMAPACELLDRAGMSYKRHIFVGHPGQVIADFACKLQADKVILGTHGRGTVSQLLLGSVSHEVIHQMDPRIPVTLVKTGYPAAL